MSDAAKEEFGDPLSRPFWQAAERRQLVVQRCAACGRHQFYPRPFCLGCQSDRVEWVRANGTGTIYSQSRLHMSAGPGFEPPYVVAVVQLDAAPPPMPPSMTVQLGGIPVANDSSSSRLEVVPPV